MPDVLIGAPDERSGQGPSAEEVRDRLADIGYHAAIRVGCLKTVQAALAADSSMVSAIVLDSQLVGQSLSLNDFPRGIVEELRQTMPFARLIVYMTKPYDDVGESTQRAVKSTDVIVDVPASGEEVAFRVGAVLAYGNP